MNQLQMLKMALIAYVNSAKAVWSIVAHPLEIFSKKGKKLKDYRIFGNSVQDGVPTPEAPIEVQSVGELTTKNLLNIDGMLNSNLVKNDDGSYTLKKTSNGRLSATVPINIPANTTFAKSVDVIDYKCASLADIGAIRSRLIFSDGTSGYTVFYDNKAPLSSGAYIDSSTKDIVQIDFYLSSEDAVGDYITFKNIQIEINNQRTEYEPYQKYKIPVAVRGKNLYKPTRLSAFGIDKPSTFVKLSNNYGTTISTTDATKGEFTVIQSTVSRPESPEHYSNGFFCFEIGQKVLTVNKEYILSFDCEVLDSLLDTDRIGVLSNGTYPMPYFKAVNGRTSVRFKYVLHGSGGFDNYIEIRNCGQSLKISNIMITEVDSNQEYEPYIEPQTHNLYLDAPLRKLGEYADYVDFEKSVVARKIDSTNVKSCPWNKKSDSTASDGTALYRYECSLSRKRYFVGGLYDESGLLCNGLLKESYVYKADNAIAERVDTTGSSGTGRTIRIHTSEHSTVANMVSAFGDFKVYYILDDAYITEEKVTLPALPTFKGTTLYEVQTSTEPSGMQACYYE